MLGVAEWRAARDAIDAVLAPVRPRTVVSASRSGRSPASQRSP